MSMRLGEVLFAAGRFSTYKESGMKRSRSSRYLILSACLTVLGGCTLFQAKQQAAPMVPPKPITVPVSKNWQVIEEAPALSDERGRLPFQTEQSVQPPGAAPLSPTDRRKLETPRQ
jgi:hypothetical protein